jgi:hypothetical protein
LGLVPVTKAGTCHFAAIDIDVDDIDHKALLAKIRARRFPLNVCRSKSGGAHCYAFFKEPVPAKFAQQRLKQWAAILGFPSVEIFPKQTSTSSQNIGNWINLPYFGGDDTTRYAFDENGAMPFQDFLEKVVYYDSTENYDLSDPRTSASPSGMPPCLAKLSESKLPEGTRNNVLFNAAVFYRKSKPATWEDEVHAHNKDQFDPPLGYREVQAVVKSAARTRYQYTCEQFPLRDNCDRATCSKLPYGVENKPWDEPAAFDQVACSRFRKVMTDPPRYILEVNEKDIELSAEEFMSFPKFKAQVFMRLDLVIQTMKQPQWEQQLKLLTETKEDIPVPTDASLPGLVLQRFHEFLSLRERSNSKEDLLRGLPVTVDELILFRFSDLISHLHVYRLDKMDQGQLFSLLKSQGAGHKVVKLNGRLTTVWSFPEIATNEQTEDFIVPAFTKPGDDEI